MTIGQSIAQRRKRTRTQRGKRQLQTLLVEKLEDRRLLAVASVPSQPLRVMPGAIAVESGLIDGNASPDLVALGSQGELAVALNGGDNTWQSLRTIEGNLGPAYGLGAGLLNADASLDLVAVGAGAARVLIGDRSGGFTLGPELAAPGGASWQPTDNSVAGVAIGHLNDDFSADIVLLDTVQHRVFVWWGRSDGSFVASAGFASGGSDPISVAVGDVVGDMRPDIVVGHRDGTISLLEAAANENFVIDATSAALQRAEAIRTLAVGDIDDDGDQDIAVGATTEAFVLRRDAHPLASPPIVNGDFARGLTGWQIESIGQRPGQKAGQVNALGGAAQIDEHSSFLTSLSQSFTVPPGPKTISIDLNALALEYADDAIPDAFELSLLNSQGQSLVATHRAGATSFFNAVGDSSGTPDVHLAVGVTYDGHKITLDISALVPGTEATLFVDLLGNPPGDGASARIDNVTIAPSTIFSHSFTLEQLPGALELSGVIRIGDVDGDARADVVVSDRSAHAVLVFNQDADGHFARSALDTASLGSQPAGVVLGQLNSDRVLDIAYTLFDSALIVTPLGADTTPPQVALISPPAGARVSSEISNFVIQFSEPVLDTGPQGRHSVTNAAAYLAYEIGANGLDESGSGDDGVLTLQGITYDASTRSATLAVAAGQLPLREGRYRLLIRGTNSEYSIRDLLNNDLAGGSDAIAEFTIDRAPVIGEMQLLPASSREGDSVTLTAAFIDGVLGGPYSATVDWGDGSSSAMRSFASVGTIRETHVYADNGSYVVGLTLKDAFDQVVVRQQSLVIANMIPTFVASSDPTFFAGAASDTVLGTFTDPGFSSPAASTHETFQARIDWGDGSSIEVATVEVRTGSPGLLTSGAVRGQHLYTSPGLYTIHITLVDDDGGAATVSLRASVLQSTTGRCLPTIDFETDATGTPLASDNPLTSQYAAWGVHVSTLEGGAVQPRVIDWYRMVGSKTVGAGGEGKILILSRPADDPGDREPWRDEWDEEEHEHEYNDDDDDEHGNGRYRPGIYNGGRGSSDDRDHGHEHGEHHENHDDDEEDGDDDHHQQGGWVAVSGTVVFSFDSPVMLDEIGLLGVVGQEKATVRVYASSGSLIKSLAIDGKHHGERQTVALDAQQVARLEVAFSGSGAISQLVFCRDAAPGSHIAIAGTLNPIEEGQTVSLQLASPQIIASEWLINWGDGSMETLAGDPATATHRFADGPAERNVYATARDAAGNVHLANGFKVAVVDVAPAISISGALDAEAGLPYTLELAATDPGADTISAWTVNWGDGVVETFAGNATSAQHVFRPRYAKPVQYKIRATARDEDNVGRSEYRSNTHTVTVRPDSSLQLPTIDFERSSAGTQLRPGQRIADQFAQLGITIATLSAAHSATIHDSGSSAAGSRDLASPHRSFGGPGEGSGGQRGTTGENRQPLGNVLVIAQGNATSSPAANTNDDEAGGTLVFTFQQPVRLDEIHLLDIDTEGSVVRLFAADGALLSSTPVPKGGVNSFQVVTLDASHVSRMEIAFSGGGAVTSIVSCRDSAPIARPESRFFVVDANDRAFRYSAPGADIGDFGLGQNVNARGIATTRDANPIWIVSEEGSTDRVYIYDTSKELLLGSWKVTGIIDPQGIATDGNDIWIVDGSTKRYVHYAGAAKRRSGTATPSDSFALNGENRQPTDLVTDGASLWIVDAGSDRVYVYNRTGSLRNQWALDPVNSEPAGITINPRASDGIFVVDAADKRVYSYVRRTLPEVGAQLAVDSFALAADNANPTGLADPGGQIAIGDSVADSFNSSGEVVDWTFPATAGQKVYINFQELSDWMRSDLIGPGGQLLYSKNSNRYYSHDSGSLTLATTGTYTLRLTSAATPSYRFQVFDIPPPDTHAVNLGQVHAGALDSPGRADNWTFTATSGTRMYLDFLTLQTVVGGDLIVDVVAPSGAVISTRTATRVNSLDQGFTAMESGEHKLVMRAAFDGAQLPTYSFQLWQVPADDLGTLSFRQPASGSIEVPGARDRWPFTAAAGQNVFLDFVRVTGGDLRVQVIQPDGTTLASRTFSLSAGLDQELVLPQAGTYTVIVDGAGTANLNTYEFTVWDIPPEVIERTTLNTTLSGFAVPGETVPFEFEAHAGTPILLDIIDSSSQALGVTIIQPDGQTLLARATHDALATLTQTGTYRALVARASQTLLDGHGTYSFRIQDASTPERGEPDNLGTRFYVAFPPNLREPFVTYNPVFSLSITSAVDTSGTVQIPGIGFYAAYEVTAGATTLVTLPGTVELSAADKIVNRGILVTALDEVAVYGLDQLQFLTEGFTALPVDALGKDYYVLGYSNTVIYVVGGGTNLTLAATANNTQVTITPAVAVGAHPAGVPFTITLNQGDAYTLHTSVPLMADLTGTRVTATEPIALWGGNTAARVPQSIEAANHLIEQLPSLEAWGRRFITLPLATRSGGDTFRILAQQDATELRIDGQLVRTLSAGQFDERVLTAGSVIEGSAPLLVAQYSNGSAFDSSQADPFMMLVPPFEQYLSDYTLSTPATGFNSNFANLVVPTSAIATVLHDDQPVPASTFAPIGASGYSGARIPISIGTHRFRASEPLGVSIYGYAAFDAYGYFGGMSAARVAAVSSLTLTPVHVALPINTQHTLSATVVDRFGAPIRGARVDFTIVGASTQHFSAATDRDGRATIGYTRAAPGSDTITAAVADQVKTATVSWLAAAPTIGITTPAPGAQMPAGKHLITGIALPGSPGTAIAEVTVNGRHVDAVDAAGNFFAVVDLTTGLQTLTFTATNTLGLEAATTIDVVGVSAEAASFDVARSHDVTTSASVQFSGTTFNRHTHRLLADMRLFNSGTEPLDATTAVRVDRITPGRVQFASPDGVSAGGQPLMFFDTELPAPGLTSGERSGPISIALINADRDRFSIDLSLLAQANRPPRFITSPELEAAAGAMYRYAAAAIDADGARISYALTSAPEGMQIDAASGLITWPIPADAEGAHQVSIAANDGRGGVATQVFTLSARASLPNRPPVFQSAPNTAVLPGEDYRYAATALDPDNDPLSFSLIEGPAGMTIDSASGLVRYDDAVEGVYFVTLAVGDARGGTATQRFTLQVGASSGISSPTIVTAPPVTAIAGGLYRYSVAAVDPMQSQLVFSLVESPAGMTIDGQSGRISWQPSSDLVGTERSVRIEVRNAFGGIGSQAYRIAVIAARLSSPPAFTSKPPTLATIGEAYQYHAVASDPDGQPLVYELATAPAGMTIDNSSGEIQWLPTAGDLGPSRILITATDPEGRIGYQQYSVSVRGINTPPVFVSTPVLLSTIGKAYRYNAVADDAEDEVTYQLLDAPADMQIDSRGGAITWLAQLAEVGPHAVTVRATDSRGLIADQTFQLTVAGDNEAPQVSIVLSQESVEIGQGVTVHVSADDNVAVTSLVLLANGQPLVIDGDGRATFTATAPGFQQFAATARDGSGNVATGRRLLRVRDPADTTAPSVALESPATGSKITYLTDIIGSVSDTNLEAYVLEYSRLNMANWHTLAARSILDGGPIDIVASRIGTFDPTLLLNDQYEVRLRAIDINGLGASASIVLNLEGNAKIGVLEIPSAEECSTCSAADVTIPVAGGPPIAITRQYSSLTTDDAGDFGQGWQFCMAEPNIRETPARAEFENLVGQFGALPFRSGDKVYITTPTCERVGFTFSPTLHTGVWSEVGSAFYDPRWVPDPGVDWQLYGENDYTRITGIASGEFDLDGLPLPLVRYQGDQYILAALSASYNPLGYQLITKDGTRYHYHQTDGLRQVTDRHGNRLSMTDEGIVSSSGQSVQFQRDNQGRITRIIDAQGRETAYTYNVAGELVKVEYPNGLSNTYRYTADHLLAAINEDNSQQAMLTRSFEYDLAGRLAATLDAFGYSNTQTYDLATRTQTTFDALGNPTTYQYDLRGNVVWERSPRGATVSMEYDDADNRTRIVDEMGFATAFTYDSRGNTTSVIDALGNTTSFTYDEANNVVYQRDARGGEYFYYYSDDENGRGKNMLRAVQPGGGDSRMTYDSLGRLLSITYVDGRVRRYEYGNLATPVRIIERDGSSIEIEYNAYGHMQAYVDQLGRRTSYTYDASERPTAITDPLGHVTQIFYQGRAIERVIDAAGNETRYVLDAESRPLQIIQPDGGVTLLEYDPNGRRTAMIDPNGNRTRYTYRSDGRQESTIDPSGGVTSFEYDPVGHQTAVTNANGHRWVTEYDALGYVTATVDPLGGRTTRSIDAMGNLTSQTDALGRTTSFEYNSIQRPTRIVDALGNATSLSYGWDGRLLGEQDPLGRVRTYTYDALNRLVSRTDPLGGSQQFSYDAAGNRLQWTDERGNATRFEYDALDRPVSITDASGATGRMVYDALGRVTSITDATGATTSIAYDGVGRPVATTDPLGGIQQAAYDLAGNVISAVDSLGRETTFTYDALNRQTSKTDPLGAITRRTYDAVGNLKTLRDPLGNVTTFAYDALERFIGSTDPLGNESSLVYDAIGNIVDSVDRNGLKTHFTYDALDRVLSEAWLSASGGTLNTATYSYDAVGNLLSAGDGSSQYAFSYDLLDRLSLIDNFGTPAAPHVTLASTYDAASNRTGLTDNAGVTVASVYDARNLLASRAWSGGEVSSARADFTYDARGMLAGIARFASLDPSAPVGSSAFHYDAKGRLAVLEHLGNNAERLAEYHYTRNLADELTSETHHGHTREFVRDALGQLTGVSIDDVSSESYTYDAHGNRVGSSEIVGADNRLLENATTRFEYDREGNLVRSIDKSSGEFSEYTYDHRQRLVSGTRRGASGNLLSSVINTYDVFNRRIARTVDIDGAGPEPATTVFTVYDGEHAWADYGANGQSIARYLFGDGTDAILARWRPGEGTAWYLTDALGTVRDIASAAGDVVDTLEYDSFGRIVSQTNPALGDRFTFTGREWDSQLNLYYYRARFYDPGAGRFISQDPLGFGAGDSNLYRYVGNSPLDYTDPSGLLALTECAFVRAVHTTVNIACSVQKMALDGSLASQDIDQQVENAFQLMNTALNVLPFGSSLALQTTLRAITIVQTAQALATLNVNEHLFTLMEVAETYVVEAYRIYEQGAADTFQEALHAFAQSDNKQLLLTQMVCGAANMGLMVLSARARCFVAGTPVVVGLLPPEEGTADQAADRWGITVLDVLAGGALVGAIGMRRRQRRAEPCARWQRASDEFFGELDRDADAEDAEPAEPTMVCRTYSSGPAETEVAAPGVHEALLRMDIPSQRQRARLKRSLAVFSCLLLALVCGLPRLLSTSVPATAGAVMSADASTAVNRTPATLTKPIEEIRCGDRIVAELPAGVAAENEPEPDPAAWRLVEVELRGEGGERVEVHLLRPLAWLEQVGTLPNGEFPLRAEELGVEGTAAVLRVQPCPPIAAGAGQVVAGTFRHTSSSLIELHLEGAGAPIICTSGHPIWSESQQDFVSASTLHSGEPVRLASGTHGRIRFQQRHPGSASVFNLEVNRHHVYHVGHEGLLVHNSGLDSCEDDFSTSRSPVARPPIRKNDIDSFQGFKDRSTVGDNLEGHEILQHAWLKENDYATTRLSTEISKGNPVIALLRQTHQKINSAQSEIDVKNQSAIENILANRQILLQEGLSRKRINRLTIRAIIFAMEYDL